MEFSNLRVGGGREWVGGGIVSPHNTEGSRQNSCDTAVFHPTRYGNSRTGRLEFTVVEQRH